VPVTASQQPSPSSQRTATAATEAVASPAAPIATVCNTRVAKGQQVTGPAASCHPRNRMTPEGRRRRPWPRRGGDVRSAG
jgi:hypothetical protein